MPQRAGSGGRDTRGLCWLRASLRAAALAGCFCRPCYWQKLWDRSSVPMQRVGYSGDPWPCVVAAGARAGSVLPPG